MPVDIRMPALSPTMEKGNLARWHKKEGDKVKPGDVIAEIETDKATMEYEAIDEGTLARIVVPEGTADVPVLDETLQLRARLLGKNRREERIEPRAIVLGVHLERAAFAAGGVKRHGSHRRRER